MIAFTVRDFAVHDLLNVNVTRNAIELMRCIAYSLRPDSRYAGASRSRTSSLTDHHSAVPWAPEVIVASWFSRTAIGYKPENIPS